MALSGLVAVRGAAPTVVPAFAVGSCGLSQVCVRNHRDGGWITADWTHLPMTGAPFAEFTWWAARQLVAQRCGDDPNETAIARALDALLTRAGNGPDSDPRHRRVVARTRARSRPTPLACTDDVPPEPAPAEDDVGDDDASLATVIPFEGAPRSRSSASPTNCWSAAGAYLTGTGPAPETTWARAPTAPAGTTTRSGPAHTARPATTSRLAMTKRPSVLPICLRHGRSPAPHTESRAVDQSLHPAPEILTAWRRFTILRRRRRNTVTSAFTTASAITSDWARAKTGGSDCDGK